jgi:hypothetical protein
MADKPKPRSHIIRWFALVCAALSSGYVMYMGVWHTSLLSANNWCVRALGAGKASDDSREIIKGAEACVSLMSQQIGALSVNSHIYAGVVALCLLVLMVIVIAGGEVSFSGSAKGVSGKIGQHADDDIVRDGDLLELSKKDEVAAPPSPPPPSSVPPLGQEEE